MSEHNAQIASLDGMPKKEKKKVLKRMVREVMKDKRYRKAIKKSPAPVSKKAANAAAVGTLAQVLVEGPSPRNPRRWCGRSLTNKMVLFSPDPALTPGTLADFRIVHATENALYGEPARTTPPCA